MITELSNNFSILIPSLGLEEILLTKKSTYISIFLIIFQYCSPIWPTSTFSAVANANQRIESTAKLSSSLEVTQELDMKRLLNQLKEVIIAKTIQKIIQNIIETIKGGHVVLACRDMKKANEACDKIKLETNSKNVFVERLDLASFESIREFAENFRSRFTRLDILINNAGQKTLYSKIKRFK